MTDSFTHEADDNLFKSRTYVRLLGLQFLFGVSYSSFLLLPKYLTRDLHASATQVGRAAAFALVAAALLAPLVGASARLASRKTMLFVAFATEASAALAFLLVDRVGPLLFVLRSLQGFSWAVVFSTTATLAAEVVPRARMAQAIGYMGLAMLGTNALAPLVTEPLADHFGFWSVFLFASVAGFAGAIFVVTLPREGAETSHSQVGRASQLPLFPVHLGSLLMGVGIGVMFTFTQPFALALGSARVGEFFMGYVTMATLVRTVFGKSADKLGPARAATFGLAAYAVSVFGTSALTPSTLLVSGAAIGACHGFLYPALTAAGMNRILPNERQRFMGWFSGAFNAGCALATLGLGPVADAYGFRVVYVVAGLAMGLGVYPLFLYAQRVPSPSPALAHEGK